MKKEDKEKVVADLTDREFRLLLHLVRRSEEISSREQLLEAVWGYHFDPGSNVVDVHVTRLRKKLEKSGADVKIAARRGIGFVLTTP